MTQRYHLTLQYRWLTLARILQLPFFRNVGPQVLDILYALGVLGVGVGVGLRDWDRWFGLAALQCEFSFISYLFLILTFTYRSNPAPDFAANFKSVPARNFY